MITVQRFPECATRKDRPVALTAFLVIPPNPGSTLSGEPVTDQFFSGAQFADATVVQLRSYAFGAQNQVAAGSAGAGTGRTRFEELSISKPVDRSSAGLFNTMATGGHLRAVQLYLRRSGGPDARPYLAYEFQVVAVTKIDWSGADGDDAASESVTFAYGALALGYRGRHADGSLTSATRAGWSAVSNSAKVADTLLLS